MPLWLWTSSNKICINICRCYTKKQIIW